jgi:hypothetical protein
MLYNIGEKLSRLLEPRNRYRFWLCRFSLTEAVTTRRVNARSGNIGAVIPFDIYRSEKMTITITYNAIMFLNNVADLWEFVQRDW